MNMWTTREIAEIEHALHYAHNLEHGTAGHNQLMLIAKMAELLGFSYVGFDPGDGSAAAFPSVLALGTDNVIVAGVDMETPDGVAQAGGLEVQAIY